MGDPYEMYRRSLQARTINYGFAAVGDAFGYAMAGLAEGALHEADESLSEFQAEDAIRRGDLESYRVLHMARQLVGKQRVAYAAGNVKVDSGSAAQVQEATAYLGAMDAATIQSNAIREAFGYKLRAIRSRFQRRSAEAQAIGGIGKSILSGAAGVSGGLMELDRFDRLYGGLGEPSAFEMLRP